MVREALEGVVSPKVATSLLFEALEEAGAVPETLDEMRSFARGPLESAVRRRFRGHVASELGLKVDEMFLRAGAGELSIDVEVDTQDGTETAQMAVVKRPVPVVVISSAPALADRLVACLGEDRVHATHVTGTDALGRAVFAHTALVVVIDGDRPLPAPEPDLVAALARIPDAATPVLWASDGAHAGRLTEAAEAAGVALVAVPRTEGIEPFLDLVLSRFAGD